MADPLTFKGVNPSTNLVDLFEKWDKTKTSMKRNICFNRAKIWISRLLKREDQVSLAPKLRHEDIQQALDHMFHECFARGMSPKDYLDFCIAPVHNDVKKGNLSETSKNTTEDSNLDNQEIFEDAKSENDGSTPLQEAGSSGKSSVPEKIDTQHEKPKTGKICKSTWKGQKCNITNCTYVHIDPCSDRECMALDGGLPLYKSRNCQKWHVRTRNQEILLQMELKIMYLEARKQQKMTKMSKDGLEELLLSLLVKTVILQKCTKVLILKSDQ